MQPLEAPMGMYTAYHRHPMNRVIHFIMVPAIVWSLMIWLDLLPIMTFNDGTSITAAFIAVGLLMLWYLMLDFALGVASVAVFTVLLVTAIQVNVLIDDAGTSALLATGVFVGSWIFQFLGHGVWEKRRPALMDNLLQVFIAPMFLVAETAFSFGFKKELEEKVEAVAATHAKPA